MRERELKIGRNEKKNKLAATLESSLGRRDKFIDFISPFMLISPSIFPSTLFSHLTVYPSATLFPHSRLLDFPSSSAMKFWKSLCILIEDTLSKWADKVLAYKYLKQQLKLAYPALKGGEAPSPPKRPRLEEFDFLTMLDTEIEKFNRFFGRKEAEFVNRWKALSDEVTEMEYSDEELIYVGQEMVNFHGEMVMLVNYSAINCLGLMKIIKKYDKRSGYCIRPAFIQKVLQQPFSNTDVVSGLVKDCQQMIAQIFLKTDHMDPVEDTNEEEEDEEEIDSKPRNNSEEWLPKIPEEDEEIEIMKSVRIKPPLSAIRVLEKIRSQSSTISEFSLPPLEINDLGDPLYREMLWNIVKDSP